MAKTCTRFLSTGFLKPTRGDNSKVIAHMVSSGLNRSIIKIGALTKLETMDDNSVIAEITSIKWAVIIFQDDL